MAEWWFSKFSTVQSRGQFLPKRAAEYLTHIWENFPQFSTRVPPSDVELGNPTSWDCPSVGLEGAAVYVKVVSSQILIDTFLMTIVHNALVALISTTDRCSYQTNIQRSIHPIPVPLIGLSVQNKFTAIAVSAVQHASLMLFLGFKGPVALWSWCEGVVGLLKVQQAQVVPSSLDCSRLPSWAFKSCNSCHCVFIASPPHW